MPHPVFYSFFLYKNSTSSVPAAPSLQVRCMPQMPVVFMSSATMHHFLQAVSQEIQPQYERGDR
jgi:hypothetical protein